MESPRADDHLPAMKTAEIRVERGKILESVHRVHAVVAEGAGRGLHTLFGDAQLQVTLRSAAKLFQALPLVEDGVVDALGLTPAELALCCASHNTEPRHVEGARQILKKAGLGEDSLACGGHRPLDEGAARELDRTGVEPGPIHNNCSGKHAGMLALAVHHGWATAGYHEPEHPVQRRMSREISRWSGLPEEEIPSGVDGCGIPCYAIPLDRMAESFLDFGLAAQSGGEPHRVLDAIGSAPGMIGGNNRLCSALPEVTGGRVIAKIGAEGVYGAVIASESIGIAVKVDDGSRRAVEPALIGVLETLGLLSSEELKRLSTFRTVAVKNTRRETVGRILFQAPG